MSWISRLKIDHAARHLWQGGIIAYPTEAVFGLGCDPMNQEAVEYISSIKGRSANKSFIVIAAGFDQIEPLLAPLTDEHKNTLTQSWPGPITWIVPAAKTTPAWLTSTDQTIAVRVSDHPIVRALCLAFGGPLISTSANPSGYPPARTALKVRSYFKNESILIVHGRLGEQSKPSAIYDLKSGTRLR